jgi:DNA-binding winged helix-turn-helix (wHTH) protein
MATVMFGPYELDTRSLELRKDGRCVALRPQPCRVLALLASQPGRLVTREEIKAAVWPRGVYVRYDLGLNSCLKQIRRALEESAEHPQYIETLTRRGYRFIGQAEVFPEPQEVQGPRIPDLEGLVASLTHLLEVRPEVAQALMKMLVTAGGAALPQPASFRRH